MEHAVPDSSRRKLSKPLVENAWTLRVHNARDADLNSCSPLFSISVGARRRWNAVAKLVAELEFRIHFDPDPEYADDADPYAKTVRVAESTCRFGGKRFWLICSIPRCGRRTATLFRLDDKLVCRACGGFSYRSQLERSPMRALRRAQAIRCKLGGSGSLLDEFPDRPKWMRKMTYTKYLSKSLYWQRRYLEAASARFKAHSD